MRLLLALFAIAPILIIALSMMWEEFRSELVTGYSKATYKVESKKSRKRIESEFPQVVELFAILLAGNLSPATALEHISRRTRGEFALLLRETVSEIHGGSSFSHALDLMNARIKSPIVRRFCDSLMIAIERGSPLVDVVNRQVEEVRNEERSQLLVAAGQAEIALMIPVVFLILPISVLFALWPSYFALGHSVGF